MAVAAYLRVSTDEQRERQTIETQREFAERYCALHNLSVFRVYSDDGVSGTVPLDRRAEGSQIIADARLRKFDQLLIYRLDRLGRDTRLILNAVAELEKLGVRVRSMTEEFDTGSATGRLMLTLLSGFAAHERDVFRERSAAGTRRVAEAGAWLGGIVPFGYRKVGEKRKGQIVVSDAPIPGLAMSEADVIRLIYRMSAAEKKSCRVIAVRLNQLRVPCAYVRDDRLVVNGKRKERTAGLWRPGRIRAMITSKTYMGVHEFGKRSVTGRPAVPRAVPAIVTEAVWKKAQANLKAHMLFSKRNAKNKYLLRGLIKCGSCGLTYVGIAGIRPNGKREFYYRCNGAHARQLFMKLERRCRSKAVRGDHLEQQVWADVESFLREPGPVLQQLHAKLQTEVEGSEETAKQIRRLEGAVSQKGAERNRVVALYRRGRLSEKALDDQMDEIGKEESALQAQLEELQGRAGSHGSVAETISSAEALLAKLRKRLDEPISWELKRQLVETLVAGIRIETVEQLGGKQAKVTVSYRFAEPSLAMSLVLPHAFDLGVTRIPAEPQTIGEHIRKRRLALKLHQKQVGPRLGVDTVSVHNWECGHSQPEIRYMPAIVRFLGYNPLPEAASWADKLVRHRTSLGMTQRDAAAHIGVDPGTLSRWERGAREPTGAFAARVGRFLGGEHGSSKLRRAG